MGAYHEKTDTISLLTFFKVSQINCYLIYYVIAHRNKSIKCISRCNLLIKLKNK